MRKIYLLAAMLAVAACTTDDTDDTDLPDVDMTVQPGTIPEVNPPNVDVSADTARIPVPDVDVNRDTTP